MLKMINSIELRLQDSERLRLTPEDATISSVAITAYGKKDYVQALSLFKQLADKNYVSYQTFVGWMYAQGIGTSQNDAEALLWYEKATALGSVECLYYSGYIFLEKGDYKQSIPWFEKAAEKNYSPAIYRLGVMYDFGMGVTRDADIATSYFNRAVSRGHVFAKRAIAVRYLKTGGVKLKFKGIFLFLDAIFNMIRLSVKNLHAEELKW